MGRATDACRTGSWHLHLWPADQAGTDHDECRRVPYLCRSWRCEGDCRQWRGALDWWRVREGLKKRRDWVMIVLTFVQPADSYGRWKTYLRAGKCWNRMRTMWARRFGQMAYVQTWERHQAGGCHCNLVVGNPDIAQWVESSYWNFRDRVIEPDAVRAGFGYVNSCKRCDDDNGGIAGYLTKLARELTGAGVKGQVPEDAPPHFRRLRASRGLLPPLPVSELAGELCRFPLPEYTDDTRPGRQLCGAVGTPRQNTVSEDDSNAADPTPMAEAGRPARR